MHTSNCFGLKLVLDLDMIDTWFGTCRIQFGQNWMRFSDRWSSEHRYFGLKLKSTLSMIEFRITRTNIHYKQIKHHHHHHHCSSSNNHHHHHHRTDPTTLLRHLTRRLHYPFIEANGKIHIHTHTHTLTYYEYFKFTCFS